MTRRALLSTCGACLASALTLSTLAAATPQKGGDPISIGIWRILHSAILGGARPLLGHVPDDAAMIRERLAEVEQAIGAAQAAGAPALFDAVKAGDAARVRALVDGTPSLVSARDDTGRTPLHWAARGTSLAVLTALVQAGADVNAADSGGVAPLHSLASRGSVEGLRLLLDRGARVDLVSAEGETALHFAAQAGRVEAVRLLVGRTADLERRNSYGRTPLVLAAREMGGIEVIRLLLDLGATIDAADRSGDTALALAAWRGSADVVDLLLDRKATVPTGTRRAGLVLDSAASKGLARLFQLMAEKGADLARDVGHGRTLVHTAAEGGSVPILRTLAGKGLDITRADAYGWTPLHFAADNGRADAVMWLLANGARIDARTTMGQSAWSVADENADLEMKALLQGKGADTAAPQFPELGGPYLGQKPPGPTPEIFAPGIVSARHDMHSNVVFSPDGTEAFWSLVIPPRGTGYGTGRTLVSRLVNGRWTYPRPAVFDGVPLEDVPFFHPDGQTLFDMARRAMPGGQPGAGEHIWVWEKGAAGWTKPRPVDATVNNLAHHWQFSVDRARTLYFTSTWEDASGIFRSRLVDGRYAEPEHLGPRINPPGAEAGFPFIAPDGSYLLHTRGQEVLVSFADAAGEWGEPVSLGPEYRGLLPIVSPDGRYLFLSRNERAYWADAGIIARLKRR